MFEKEVPLSYQASFRGNCISFRGERFNHLEVGTLLVLSVSFHPPTLFPCTLVFKWKVIIIEFHFCASFLVQISRSGVTPYRSTWGPIHVYRCENWPVCFGLQCENLAGT